MNQMFKLGAILALYAAVACTGLAVVYEATQKVIVQREKSDLEASLKEIFPEAASFDPVKDGLLSSGDAKISFAAAYRAVKDGSVLGLVIKAAGPSYGGEVTVLVGTTADGHIKAAKVLSTKDTAGLGANAANPSYYVNKEKKLTFTGQFAGKSLADPFTVKQDVDAITASTITSRSVTAIVRAAGTASAAYLSGGAQ